jgi:hypothetical protein
MSEMAAEHSLARNVSPTRHQVTYLCLNLIISPWLITVASLHINVPPALFGHHLHHSSPDVLGKDLVPLIHEVCHWGVVVCRVGEFAAEVAVNCPDMLDAQARPSDSRLRRWGSGPCTYSRPNRKRISVCRQRDHLKNIPGVRRHAKDSRRHVHSQAWSPPARICIDLLTGRIRDAR